MLHRGGVEDAEKVPFSFVGILIEVIWRRKRSKCHGPYDERRME